MNEDEFKCAVCDKELHYHGDSVLIRLTVFGNKQTPIEQKLRFCDMEHAKKYLKENLL